MAYIVPSSTIQFFGDTGLSPNYDDTFWFSSAAARDSYFDDLAKLATAASCSYTREKRGFVRVQISMSTLIYAQYMRFRNPSYESKWFYAFVKSVNYINNETTEVEFEIDVMQTWMGQFTLANCMVEREHPISDNIGGHLMDEGLSVGDYLIAHMEQITPYTPTLVISSTVNVTPGEDPDDPSTVEDAEAEIYCGFMPSGVRYRPFQLTVAGVMDSIKAWLDAVIKSSKKDGIVSMRIVPAYCRPIASLDDTGTGLAPENIGTFTSNYALTSLNGYIPRNNKLFSYPYIVYEAINGEGSANEYRLEFFSNPLTPAFQYFGISFDNAEALLVPYGYKNSGIQLVLDEALIMRQFPQASYNIDQYKAWVAQMTSGGGWISVAGHAAETIGNAIGAASSALTPAGAGGAVAGGITSLASQALGLLSEKVKYDALPPAVRGTSNANILSAMGQKRFIGYYKTIQYEYAAAIDRYFDMYGYKVNLMKTPSMHNRPRWTYTKTSGCIVHGSLPADDAAKIERIFDKGCRFWNVGNVSGLTIGDYSGSNAPS